MNIVFFLCRIFFEPEAFFCKPSELPTKENGGVALLKGKKVRRRIFGDKGNYNSQPQISCNIS